jgi:hypothetical protein
MNKFKTIFAAAIVLATVASTATAATVMYKVSSLEQSKTEDSRVVLGHRVTPSGQEVLVYAR